jgi:hypothetical protein
MKYFSTGGDWTSFKGSVYVTGSPERHKFRHVPKTEIQTRFTKVKSARPEINPRDGPPIDPIEIFHKPIKRPASAKYIPAPSNIAIRDEFVKVSLLGFSLFFLEGISVISVDV